MSNTTTMKNKTMKKQIRVGVQRNITDKNCPVESVPLLSVLEQMHASENLKAITTAIVKAQNKHEVDALKRTAASGDHLSRHNASQGSSR